MRASWIIAFLCFLIGAIAGHVVSEWRTRGRRVVDHLIGLTGLREQLAALGRDTAPAAAAKSFDDLGRLFAAIETRARAGANVADDLADAEVRVGALRGFVALLRKTEAVAPFNGDLRREIVEQIRAGFAAKTFDAALVGALLDKLADETTNVPPLLDLVDRAQKLADFCTQRLTRMPILEETAAMQTALQALRARFQLRTAHRRARRRAATQARSALQESGGRRRRGRSVLSSNDRGAARRTGQEANRAAGGTRQDRDAAACTCRRR